MTKYNYVDAWFTDENGKPSKPTRVHLNDLPEWQKKTANNFNCFATVQQYKNAVKSEKEDEGKEEFLTPLFFDLDYDIDPEVSRLEAVKLVKYFKENLLLSDTDFYIYFSGSKGFHIIINPEIFGIKPGLNTHKILKHIAGFLQFRLAETASSGEKILMKSIDFNVYGVIRQLRLPNSIHAKTGLHKIELTFSELETLDLNQIRKLAEKPRFKGAYPADQREENSKVSYPEAEKFFAEKASEFEIEYQIKKAGYNDEGFKFTEFPDYPVCVSDILENGWKKDGDRNMATIQLACYFKAADYSEKETIEILSDWVLQHTSADTNYQKQERRKNTANVVSSVFNPLNSYKFGCAFIRSLHGEKSLNSDVYERVACSGRFCKFVPDNSDNIEDAEIMHLSECSNSAHVGKLIKTSVMVAGKKQTPYIVPQRIEYQCFGYGKCQDENCPLFNIASHIGYKDLTVKDRELIQMCGMNDSKIKQVLKDLSRIHKCTKFKTTVTESVNVEELLVIPYTSDQIIDDIDSQSRYVLRKIYCVGDTSIEVNRYYDIIGYVFPHPLNQEGTIFVRKAEPLQDVIESFFVDKKLVETLSDFKPTGNTIDHVIAKLSEIVRDLTHNVTGIVERDDTLISILLTYFSVLRLKVPWNNQPIRGWVETVIIGDTGTGKSDLIDKIIKHIGIGRKVNAESTTRTGLTYKMEQLPSGSWSLLWGAWPLADRELIHVDECSAIDKATWGELTLARSDGKLEVKRAVTAETTCRVRAILSGNAIEGKRLSDFGQGCESLKEIFNHEDIRRFDQAVFMRLNDVSPEHYNKKLSKIPQIFSSEVMKNGVLFAWSRKLEQTAFTLEAITAILDSATKLSKRYGTATDIPLVSASDQRNKIARLSAALASLLHSVDKTGEVITVKEEHVAVIEKFLCGLYDSPGCGLNFYSKMSVKEEDLSESKYRKIEGYLQSNVRFLNHPQRFHDLIKVFSTQSYLRLSDLESVLAVDKDDVKNLSATLVKSKMIQMTPAGIRKTGRFNSFIKKALELGVFDEIEEKDIFDDIDGEDYEGF